MKRNVRTRLIITPRNRLRRRFNSIPQVFHTQLDRMIIIYVCIIIILFLLLLS